MDINNFLNENNIYQNLKDFQTQQQENIKSIKDEYLKNLSELSFPIIEGFGELQKFGSKIAGTYQKASKAVQDVKSNVENIGENIKSKASDIQTELKTTSDNLTNKFKDVMNTNLEPENLLNQNSENMAGFQRVQNMYNEVKNNPYDIKSITESDFGLPSIEPGAEVEMANLGASLGEGLETGVSEVASVASDISKGALSALSDVAEVGLGDILGPVGGLFSVGLGIYDAVKAFEPSTIPQTIIGANPSLEPML